MTREEAAKVVNLLQEVYPGFRSYQSPNAAAAWYIALEHLTYEQVRTAVIDIVREGQIKPAPADIARRYPVANAPADVSPAPPRQSPQWSDFMRMLGYLPADEAAVFLAKAEANR